VSTTDVDGVDGPRRQRFPAIAHEPCSGRSVNSGQEAVHQGRKEEVSSIAVSMHSFGDYIGGMDMTGE
jgi:hypothetical protein